MKLRSKNQNSTLLQKFAFQKSERPKCAIDVPSNERGRNLLL